MRIFAAVWLLCVPVAVHAQVLKTVPTHDGVWIQEGDQKVLFYQRQPKSLNGKFTRANYVHPLLDLDGEAVTEDFPADHPHHRGIFWSWHQVYVGKQAVGDPWALKDSAWDVRDVQPKASDNALSLQTTVEWLSPLWKDAQGKQKPFVREHAIIRVHKAEPKWRAIDFEIWLRALEDDLTLGGAAEPAPGYGGFSPRLKLAKDVRFLGPKGLVEALPGPVAAAPWMDVSGTLGDKGMSGVAILIHPDTPGYPQPWILRAKRSMQNPVYPGPKTVPLSTMAPLVLKYRLIVHRGEASIGDVEVWHRDYAGRK